VKDLEAWQSGPFRDGECSWWILGDELARLLCSAILDAGGVVWVPIEVRRELTHRAVDGTGTAVRVYYEDFGFKPRWWEGPDPLMDNRCDTKWSLSRAGP